MASPYTAVQCRIDALHVQDAPYLERLFIDPQTRAYLGGSLTSARARERVATLLNTPSAYPQWAVREPNGAFVGWVSLDVHHDGKEIELSYQCLPTYWGRGYAFSACQQVIAFAFNRDFPLGIANAVDCFGRAFRAILFRRIPDTPKKIPRKSHPKSIRHRFAT